MRLGKERVAASTHWGSTRHYVLCRELVRCTPFCVRLCGTTAGSRFMLGRHRYGTALSTSCCVLPGWWTHMLNSGLGIWQHRQRNVASVCWAPLGTDAYVRAHLQDIVDSHQVLLGRIPAVPDLQSAWVLLLYCASTRANYFLRVCLPDSLYRLLCSMTTMCGIVCVN